MTCCGEKVNTPTFIWIIENFCLFELRGESYLESPIFTTFLNDGVKLRLGLFPRRGESCSLFLFRETNDARDGDITLSYYFEIICTNDDVFKSDEKTSKLKKGGCDYWSRFIEHKNILENRSKFLPTDCLTIHLHMRGEEVSNTHPIVARTEIVAEKCSLLWSICNFSSCVSRKTKFSFPSGNGYELTVDASDEDIKISICETSSGSSHFLRSEIFVQDSIGARKWSKLQEHKFDLENKTWVFPSFLKKSKLAAEKRNFLINDMLCLHCEFALSTGAIRDAIKYHFEEFSGTSDIIPACLLQEDVQNMFTSKKMADVTFKVDGKTLPAHKFVLVARSPVFSAMFEREMLENKSGIVEIPDMNYETLEDLLKFMYGAKLEDLNFERAMKLVVAADKYQVLPLKDECLIFLKLSLCNENFSQVLTLSDMIQDEILKMSAIEYFKTHRKTILRSTEWKELVENNVRLATEVLTIFALDD